MPGRTQDDLAQGTSRIISGRAPRTMHLIAFGLILLSSLTGGVMATPAARSTSARTQTAARAAQTLPPGVLGVKRLRAPVSEEARATIASIPRTPGHVILAYWRPDGQYSQWNLWTWSPGGGGTRREFTSLLGRSHIPGSSLAFLSLPRAELFPAAASRLGFMVRTDAWEKDPGTDMFWDLAGGTAFLVVSGDPRVYPLDGDTPLLLAGTPVEIAPGKFSIRVRTLGQLALAANRVSTPAGFRLSGGLKVASVRPWTEPAAGANTAAAANAAASPAAVTATPTRADDLELTVTGRIRRNQVYTITHPLFEGALRVSFPAEPLPAPPLTAATRRALPEPVLDGNPEWIELYWDAWRFMHEKLTRGDVSKGFVPLYIDEGFNENIYQWDSCFMAAYAIYGLKVFPAMAALDNFYNLQRASDGYICRTYNENTGLATGEADINPPLFAWLEWRYWRATGDSSRLARVLPVLDRYFQWCKANARGPAGQGLYYITDLGSGMDNSPRGEFIKQGAWIDISAQQALAALSIARLASITGDRALAQRYGAEFSDLARLINEKLWYDDLGNYYDKTEAGAWHDRATIASFWPMLAEVSDDRRTHRMIDEHLKNPASFYRSHVFPTLAAHDPDYDATGHYWRGGVWAPTTYMAIKGIERVDHAFARTAAENHIAAMSRVHRLFRPDRSPSPLPSLTEPNITRNGDGRRQIWEAYSPDLDAPATRWDAHLLVRQKFCGWSGLGPVALLIENVLGFERDVPENTLTWRISRTDRHGIRRLEFGDGSVTLVAAARRSTGDPIAITGRSSRAVKLVVYRGDETTPCLERVLPVNRSFTFRTQPVSGS